MKGSKKKNKKTEKEGDDEYKSSPIHVFFEFKRNFTLIAGGILVLLWLLIEIVGSCNR